MKLTIVYVTGRAEPHFEWFFDSLRRQIAPTKDVEIIVVDFYAQPFDGWPVEKVEERFRTVRDLSHGFGIDGAIWHTPPKPTVYQGPHRLTKGHWWDKSNGINTALCMASGDYLACSDDRGCLGPRWMEAVRDSMVGDPYIICGTYEKVQNLKVKDGLVESFDQGSQKWLGIDHRIAMSPGDGPSPCSSSWAFGCAIGIPVEWALQVNGWPEALCSGSGFEDVIMGVVLGNNGFPFKLDKRMHITEDRGPHTATFDFTKRDFGKSPNDKSHRILEIAQGSKRFDNDFDIRQLRAAAQAGEAFPIRYNPNHDWYTSIPLKDLDQTGNWTVVP